MLAPICLFTYNRLSETQQTVTALQKNYLAAESELFVFSDGPKNKLDEKKINEIRQYLKSITGFRKITIFESKQNKGLANSIISGVTKIIQQYGKVIVLEDDLITSPNFLDFMNQALDFYFLDNKIKSINGYSLDILKNGKSNTDVFFHVRTFSWGWATWEDRWDKSIFAIDYLKSKLTNELLTEYGIACGSDAPRMLMRSIQGLNDSWYAKWLFSHFYEKKIAVYPYYSKVKNIGYNNEGTHCKTINVYRMLYDNSLKRRFIFREFDKIDGFENKKFLNYFTYKHKILYRIYLLKNFSGIKLLMKELISKLK